MLQLDGKPVNGPDDLSLRVSEMAPGAVAHLQVYRNGHSQPIDVTLGTYPENAAAGRPAQGPSAALEGLQVQNLTSDLAQQLGLPAGMTGVFVTKSILQVLRQRRECSGAM